MNGQSKPKREVKTNVEPERDGSELPEGWAQCCVDEVFKVASGGTPSRAEPSYWNGKVPWLSSGDIKTDEIEVGSEFITQAGLQNSTAKLCAAGSIVVVVRSGVLKHTLPVALLRRPAAINQDMKCFESGHDDLNRWLALALRTASRRILAENREGTTVQSVKSETLREFTFPLPPLPEQHRIVAKLELLLAKVSSSQQRLSRIPGLLKRFRQSVLAAACSGKLTADWREEADEPATSPRDEDIVAIENVPTIPSTWTYRRAAEIVAKGTVISYGMVLPGPNQSEGIPYIRGQDIDDFGNIRITQLWRTKPEIAAKHRRSELHEGDVLLCVIRHLRVAIVPRGLDGANLTQGTVRLRPSNKILGPYLARCLASPQSQDWMKSRYIGMAMPRINVEHAREIPIPLPPLAEQQEIVRRVEKLFAFADQIEARLKHAQAHVDRLTQALLAKAFRGELVPTEHALAERKGRDYETAEQLLVRIRAAKADERPASKEKLGRSKAGPK